VESDSGAEEADDEESDSGAEEADAEADASEPQSTKCCKQDCMRRVSKEQVSMRRNTFSNMTSEKKQEICFYELQALASAPDPNGTRTICTR
jgi:hypothetical protein